MQDASIKCWPQKITNSVTARVQVVCTRWGSDPLARGSYSSVAVGALGGEEYDAIAEQVRPWRQSRRRSKIIQIIALCKPNQDPPPEPILQHFVAITGAAPICAHAPKYLSSGPLVRAPLCRHGLKNLMYIPVK